MTTRLLIGAAFLMLGFSPGIEPIDVSGHWTVTVTTAEGEMTGTIHGGDAGEGTIAFVRIGR